MPSWLVTVTPRRSCSGGGFPCGTEGTDCSGEEEGVFDREAACPMAVSSTTFDDVALCIISEGDVVTSAAAYRVRRPPTNAVQSTDRYTRPFLTTI